jgi:hypothetical protein
VVTRHERHARLFHHALRGRLVAHRRDRFGRRPDEHDAGGAAGGGEFRVLRQEAVAGMDGPRSGFARGGDHRGNVEVVVDAARAVGEPDVKRVAVGV